MMYEPLPDTKQSNPKIPSHLLDTLPIFVVLVVLLLGAITLVAIQQDTIIKLREQAITQHCAEYDNYTGKFQWVPNAKK